MSEIILNLMMKVDGHYIHPPHYKFIYKDLKRIIRDEESVGSTRVRFVSKGLRFRNDAQFRHVSLEFVNAKNDMYVSEIYSNISVNSDWKDEFAIALPNVDVSLHAIREADESCKSVYLLGLHDCRHHVSDMLKLCYPLEKKL